jgi:hypothetical protein
MNPMWGLGALAVLVLLGLFLWGMSGDTNTASNTGDTNTGTVTRTAPQPPAPAIPAAPAAPAPSPAR